MKSMNSRQIIRVVGAAAALAGLAFASASAMSTPQTVASNASANNQARLSLIITRGNNEITRRLNTLQTLNAKINNASKLTAGDKTSLSNEVQGEISALIALKSKLDGETDVASARTDAQAIITNYRVYVLVVPKVNLIRVADDQQVVESKLLALAPKLSARVSAAQSAGKNVTSLQNGLADMSKQTSNAQAISAKIESTVIGLQPSDYNSDHSVLSGDRDQLKTAQTSIKAAVNDATTIVYALKNL